LEKRKSVKTGMFISKTVLIIIFILPMPVILRDRNSSKAITDSVYANNSVQIVSKSISGENKNKAAAMLGSLPLAFEENMGQTAPEVRFLARGLNYTLYLLPDEAVWKLQESGHKNKFAPGKSVAKNPGVLRMKLAGANKTSSAEGLENTQGRSSYFIGNAPAKWVKNAKQYRKIAFRQVYPGIDLFYYGSEGMLEYDFVVGVNADPGKIRMKFEGASGLKLDEKGNLEVSCGNNFVVMKAPVLYQKDFLKMKKVDGRSGF
jgi:hypothetical protein